MKVEYLVGTMIELPAAALSAGEIAQEAEFFSFGTNDLTQTTFGISRDDCAKIINAYVKAKIWPADPFAVLDPKRVGRLLKLGYQGRPRSTPRQAEGGHLRRARRRPVFDRGLRRGGTELRELLALPRAHRAPGGSPGGREEANGERLHDGVRQVSGFRCGRLGVRAGALAWALD